MSRSSADELAQELRNRFGVEALDFVVLERAVALAADWRDNNFGHGARLLAAWRVLEGLVDAGVARAPGIGHAGEAVLDLLRGHTTVPPALNLIEHHPFLRSDSLVAECRERGVSVFGLQPLGPPAEGATGYQALDHPAVAEIAGRHGRTPAEVVLRWSLDRLDAVVLDDGGDAGGRLATRFGGLRAEPRRGRRARRARLWIPDRRLRVDPRLAARLPVG